MDLESQLGMIGRVVRSFMPAALKPRHHLMRRVERLTQCTVKGGPFSGMRYIEKSYYSAYYPKLIGTYEREIAACIEELIGIQPDLLIDIGAAEGYYAVGFARRMPSSKIVAYEVDAYSRGLLRRMAAINSVDDVLDVREACNQTALQELFSSTSLGVLAVVCDVEGFEAVLLDPLKISELRAAYILVEVHDIFVEECGKLLMGRFAATHDITRINESPRSLAEYPFHNWYSRIMPRRYVDWLMWEGRPQGGGIYWLWLRPKGNGGT